ncbi:MAG TPA: hypothetical protein GX714_14235 [Chloroflexi bacterium]|jgi:nitroreductase|nr:hypothetical protein [Chloroflexota bacterium]
MDFFDVVARRYCHKAAFDPTREVPAEHLRRLVEVGMAAPSAGNGQAPEFVIVNDPEILARVKETIDNVPLKTAPAWIVIAIDPARGCYLEDYAVATAHVLLAATALGYCCGWVDGPFLDDAVRGPASEILGLPDDRRLMVAVPVGFPGEEGPRRPKKPFEQRASWNRYAVERTG